MTGASEPSQEEGSLLKPTEGQQLQLSTKALEDPIPTGRVRVKTSNSFVSSALHPSVTPTSPPPPPRSEHFKPCRDKDLAYCLNEGECFIVETLTGSHKHCR
ncbi:pro-neuregulin-3, membrane-bound isoform-like isoform X1 [Arapaima gigas]